MLALIIFSAIGILLQILGLLVIWNERFYLLSVFAASQIVTAITNLTHGFFISSIICVIIFCLSMWFLYDLHVLRQDLKQLELLEERSKSYWTSRLQQPRVSLVSHPSLFEFNEK